jgi:hypothetical protein
MLHEADAANPPAADHRIQVDRLDLQNQAKKVARLWEEHVDDSPRRDPLGDGSHRQHESCCRTESGSSAVRDRR